MRIVVDKNLMVPMRDGVPLATDVYRPDGPGPFPTLVQRCQAVNRVHHTRVRPSRLVLPVIRR